MPLATQGIKLEQLTPKLELPDHQTSLHYTSNAAGSGGAILGKGESGRYTMRAAAAVAFNGQLPIRQIG